MDGPEPDEHAAPPSPARVDRAKLLSNSTARCHKERRGMRYYLLNSFSPICHDRDNAETT